MGYRIKPGEIALVVKPVEHEGEWTGELHTGLIFGPEHLEEGMRHALEHIITMAATQRFIEDFPEFLEDYEYYKAELLKEIFPEAYAEAERELEEENKIEREGNVIKLSWWTETKGNA